MKRKNNLNNQFTQREMIFQTRQDLPKNIIPIGLIFQLDNKTFITIYLNQKICGAYCLDKKTGKIYALKFKPGKTLLNLAEGYSKYKNESKKH